ncbi:ketopantoate reductase family protein [Halomarina ordinaria]|uniref:2-dehydropantoate 2-reductase n=1 Tax=Halomarina ordinaria TaxID=3033939 RepID=A0ABD5UAF8_9EURY|nr:ketopantoate reductase family protein [Halomarina sp. PSRA2]
MDVVVFGAGSLGSLVGGLLAREHDVTLVGRAAHVERVRASGLRIEGEVEATVHPAARTTLPARADLALVTVKSFDTERAARALARCDVPTVLSLQNGLDNEATLAAHLDGRTVLAGTCTYGARLLGPGRVACTGVGEVALGAREGGPSVAADRTGRAFERAGVEHVVAEDMPRRVWEKLAVNAGVNAATALARVPNGALSDPPGRDVAHAAAREVAQSARGEGIDLTEARAVASVDRVVRATASNRSSMLQDVERGTRTEIDAINGRIAGPDAPVNATLAALVRTWEDAEGLRES